jgi:hypothetical protein
VKQDRFGNWYEDQDTTTRIPSSQIRARSTQIVPQSEQDEYEDYVFESRPIPRRSTAPSTSARGQEMSRLYEEENRRGGPAHTDEDPQLRATRAYQLPRAKMIRPGDPLEETPRPGRKMSRRAAVYTVAGSLAAVGIGGLFIKSKVEEIQAREKAGQFGFITEDIVVGHKDTSDNPTEISAWITPDYKVHFYQSSGDKSDLKEIVNGPITSVYHGPLNAITLTFALQKTGGKFSIILRVNAPQGLIFQFNDNGKFFV